MKRIVTFGEIMLRLTPPDRLRFNQTKIFQASYGGSEANVAVALANYGLPSEFVTCLPDNRTCSHHARGTESHVRYADRPPRQK